ncbi:nucleoside-diphosphate-sugar epimerase [Motilibacter rhizosphaerae]|uniref:Nucleoside-diphosphate-sugar epimerase n=1 Tax=Motilibacter rhizosphaerae TaxID=598652 RepID=A0A4Q7NQA2_9ACTN|nr:NAD-dependent epimerase/dehydratase family protein [Motilibacter rhizosphaerae]RZS87176.1 nucleoside-diphosphate-sugar epimerase [Motilibacter rhizosphaerae]
MTLPPSAERGVRGQRTPGLRVAVAGADGPVGAAVVAALAQDPGVAEVLALVPEDASEPGGTGPDAAAPDGAGLDGAAPAGSGSEGPGARVLPVDLHGPGLAAVLDGVDALVAPSRAVQPVLAAATALTAAAAARVPRVVLVTSAEVYGALPDNPVPLDEDAPLRAAPGEGHLRDLLEVEAMAARAPLAHPGLEVAVLRPATLVGPGLTPALAGHFAAPRLLVVRGSVPRWQFCHLDDLATAAALVVTSGLAGPLPVASPGWLEQEQVEVLSGLRRIELPPALAFSTAERLHRVGVVPGPATDLAYVVHPWVVSPARLEAAGWVPAHDNVAAFRALLDALDADGRRGLGRDATLASAGAAVAVVGTAALVRAARRRRSGR